MQENLAPLDDLKDAFSCFLWQKINAKSETNSYFEFSGLSGLGHTVLPAIRLFFLSTGKPGTTCIIQTDADISILVFSQHLFNFTLLKSSNFQDQPAMGV